MRNSEKITQTFNGLVKWQIAGGYFKLMSTVSPVTVELFSAGEIIHKAQSVEGGHYQRIDFDAVAITTVAPEAVSWLYAPQEGGSDRFSGSVDVTDRAARQLGIVSSYGWGLLGQIAQQSIGGVNVQTMTDRGFAYGAAFASITNLAAAANETVVAPGSNTNGVIVWGAEIFSWVSAQAGWFGLIAKSSAPASLVDGDVILTFAYSLPSAAGAVYPRSTRARAVFVAAGKGLYFRNGAAAIENQCYRSVLYTVL